MKPVSGSTVACVASASTRPIAQVENNFGISDIRFGADDTATLTAKDGDEVSWIVRPYCVSGTSKAGRSYAFLSLRFVQDAALAL